MTPIHGTTDPRFQAVRDAFAANFRDHGDVGAALCVYHRGRRVVDLWGGIADPTHGAPWVEDTLQYVFSTTKGFTATCAHLLAQRGELDLDAPVADYWPEFAAAGKHHIPVRWLLSHRAGLPALDTPIPLADALAWHPMTTALAAQHPLWPPGSAHGYHAQTFGWLVGEVIRRITGRTPGAFFADDIAGPLGLDAYIGLPPAHQQRVSRLIEPPGAGHTDSAALRRASALTTPRIDPNDPRVHAAEIPSSNGITTARALARFYNALIDPTEGCSLLTPATLTAATIPQSDALDRTLGVHTRFGLGYALTSATFPLFGPGSFGHGGRGGSLGAAHPPSRTTVGYVMNHMRTGLTTDRRFTNLARAITTSL
ncbi:MAG: serine hydrolase domain-containing protein [Pseudonocardiaceae bacterium]